MYESIPQINEGFVKQRMFLLLSERLYVMTYLGISALNISVTRCVHAKHNGKLLHLGFKIETRFLESLVFRIS